MKLLPGVLPAAAITNVSTGQPAQALAAFIAIGASTGLRSAEIQRLDSSNVRPDRGFIEVHASRARRGRAGSFSLAEQGASREAAPSVTQTSDLPFGSEFSPSQITLHGGF